MKKLILAVLFALLASACGGSDDAVDTATEPEAGEQTSTDSDAGTDDGADDGVDDESADGTDEADLPPLPARLENVQNRDCAHSAAELGSDDGADEQADEVELPPAEKPPVDSEYLVPVDEIITTDLIEGTGAVAIAGATVDMQYVGVLADGGEQFDASWDRGAQPFTFTLGGGQVIEGWDVGIEGMKVGGRRVLQIPSAQAYGDQARSDVIGANADLVFIVDLISVSPPPEPAPPIDDSNLGSFGELQITDLVVGEGCTAEVGDIVAVNYVGVDAVTGEEFDSSWGRGIPFEVIVGRSQVIDGWNEGIEGMKVGGERILQIPAGMAYGEGDLVFRVHLEELVEAPFAHSVTFEGAAPRQVAVTTLVEGDGEEVLAGSIVDANIVVMLFKSNTIVQSSWQDGQSTQLALQAGALLPGLEEGMIGTKVGELRQIILPPSVAYPDGVPQGSGIEPDDALVFLVQPLTVVGGG